MSTYGFALNEQIRGISRKERTLGSLMADDRVREWAQTLGAAEVRAFTEARRRFLRRPSSKHLHELRTAARRLRSLFDDFHDVLRARRPRRLRRLIAVTGEARDAAVLRKTLRSALDTRERAAARATLRELRARERACFLRVRRLLAGLRYKQ
jgi:CHAD domain-containing protein